MYLSTRFHIQSDVVLLSCMSSLDWRCIFILLLYIFFDSGVSSASAYLPPLFFMLLCCFQYATPPHGWVSRKRFDQDHGAISQGHQWRLCCGDDWRGEEWAGRPAGGEQLRNGVAAQGRRRGRYPQLEQGQCCSLCAPYRCCSNAQLRVLSEFFGLYRCFAVSMSQTLMT